MGPFKVCGFDFKTVEEESAIIHLMKRLLDERSALLQFKETFLIIKCYPDVGYPKIASWNLEENSECCSWDGIKCNEDTGSVIKLDLRLSCLKGSINSSSTLFNLVHLQWFCLAYNDFSYSQIPYAVKNRSKLSYLDLSRCKFSGQIPSEMLELSRLESLDLSDFGGMLQLQQPGLRSLVDKLTKLKRLDLSWVNISSSIPNSLGNLSSLTDLSLIHCQLQGVIPSSLGNLFKLASLDISSNHFLGDLPISIGNLGNLQYLSVSSCQFSDQVQSSLSNLTHLKSLDLSDSKISGHNSDSLSWLPKLTKLTDLYLDNSNLVEKREDQSSESITFAFDWKIVLTGFVSGLIVGVILGNEYFTKIVEWFATNNLGWQLKTAIKRKTWGHIN
ncbi:hypothetical protein EZV62_027703 [Acer yangbiense]|uniref:Uncharacterized protein n=1 Tax=Acer yangbiense TaxID=1000413 RepID=A0A5C7GV72_9ROSI|nr:hypothetical protein EZV62_027703 [Acer yangbiense]